MVQALAFAELFAGGILFLCGYKGYTPPEVVKGEAGDAKPLGHGSATGSGSGTATGTVAGGEGSTEPQRSAPAGGKPAPAPKEAATLTWGQLRREIEAHKLTPKQVEERERQLLGGNHPPVR